MTRLARLSISLAHAACTALASIVEGSSRLASSSAATSARWSMGSVRASRSKSCARSVMASFYARDDREKFSLFEGSRSDEVADRHCRFCAAKYCPCALAFDGTHDRDKSPKGIDIRRMFA